MMNSWIKPLIRWLRRLFGLRSPGAAVKILRRYDAEDGSVSAFQLHDPSIPGAVDCWKIERHVDGVGWFCVAIDLAHLRQDLAQRSHFAGGYRQRHHEYLAEQLASQLAEQSQFLATHYWVCGVGQLAAGIDSSGRSYQARRTYGLTLIAGDYQGIGGIYAGQKYIERLNRTIVHELANSEFFELRYHASWKRAVLAIDWARWHEQILRSENGIAPDHCLQVKRNRLSKR